MTTTDHGYVGFACSYVPLAVIDAAGYVPWRVLPMSGCPDQAGQLLHDNLCPHVKRIIDRALADDLPQLEGMVFINSCDAMRRMADAWQRIRPNDKTIMLDLPSTQEPASVAFFAQEVKRLAQALADWSGTPLNVDAIRGSSQRYDVLARLLVQARERLRDGTLDGGPARMQTLYNQASMEPVETSINRIQEILAMPATTRQADPGVPVFLFGNVLPDPEVFTLFEDCGAFIVGDDFCTGSRLFAPSANAMTDDPWQFLAEEHLLHPPCARTFDPARPGQIARDVLQRAQACSAQGVIGYTLKFCDPYLARMPLVRAALREANLPVLVLEGDCTLRSIGQQRTRIEAFIEMLR
jgi:benzoyl-CoA reductase/2-hydroxyglutaryl-CoA dehydratase subunit BcrC/BadD/HgdB